MTRVLLIISQHCSEGKGVETQNCPKSSFSHNFCHWLPEKVWKIKRAILQLLVLNQIGDILWSITTLLGTQTSSLVSGLVRQNLYFSDLYQVKPNYEHFKEGSTIDSSLHMRLLLQEHKFPNCVIKRRDPETKSCQNTRFSNNIYFWNPNNKETFLFHF